jgi:hypothetical protein
MTHINRSKLVSLTMLATLASVFVVTSPAPPAAGAKTCPKPSQPILFDKQKYIDTTRGGGEPTVEQHPDGTLLYGSHAGTTHFYTPAAADDTTAAFVQNYTGQTYYYFSKDHGKTWTYQDRTLPPNNTPMSGFSDPEYAIDAAGQVYVSEINLLNVAVSKATSSDEPFTLQNFFAQTFTDRQWMEADKKDVLYLVGNALGGGTVPTEPVGHMGHYLHRSTDGGKTFTAGVLDGDGLGDLQIDRRDGTLYEAYYTGDRLSLVAYREARKGNLDKKETYLVASGVNMLAHWPSFDLDAAGNIYMTWDESGRGGRPAGIYFSYSTTRGKTWSAPARVDTNNNTDIWPWLAVGDNGKVAVAWLGANKSLPNQDAETAGDHEWRIYIAQTLNGLGCGSSKVPGFRTTTATPQAVHTGTICQGGTTCQAMAIDRRLGDFFTIEIDNGGHVWAGYSDTQQGGGVALPGFVHQRGGIPFVKQPAPPNPSVDGGGNPGGQGSAGGGGGSGGGSSGGNTQGSANNPAADDVSGSATSDSGSSLAFTGAAIIVFVVLALGLLVVGVILWRRAAPKP